LAIIVAMAGSDKADSLPRSRSSPPPDVAQKHDVKFTDRVAYRRARENAAGTPPIELIEIGRRQRDEAMGCKEGASEPQGM